MTNLQSLALISASTIAILLLILTFIFCRKNKIRNQQYNDIESREKQEGETKEELVTFEGGEDLAIGDILEAPGEVIGKSRHGTLYRAYLERSSAVRVLRFLRPASTQGVEDLGKEIEIIGCVRHRNLVPLLGYYSGFRAEKLLLHPFYSRGNLSHFIRDGNGESHRWIIIYRISIGIARALDHLHTALHKPIIHGNLQSKNILLDRNHEPYISDFGLHLLLNSPSAQQLLESSAANGYKAPEMIKMKDANEETDIYSYGIILLELLSGKEPINGNPTSDDDFYLPNFMRNAVLGHRIAELFHPGILLYNAIDGYSVTEEKILKFFQLAMACCSPSPALRPSTKQILRKLEEIGK